MVKVWVTSLAKNTLTNQFPAFFDFSRMAEITVTSNHNVGRGFESRREGHARRVAQLVEQHQKKPVIDLFLRHVFGQLWDGDR